MDTTKQRRKNSRCRYFERGYCQFGDRCRYLHEPLPSKGKKQKSRNPKHIQLEDRSKGKICSICFEEVMTKKKGANKFGILPNCKHCFCFSCIKRWRKSIHFEDEVTKGCPECRVNSNHVYKNSYWVDDDYKGKFIAKRNEKLSTIDCKYFRGGMGMCFLGDKCLFRHVLELDLSPPSGCSSPSFDDAYRITFRRVPGNRHFLSYLEFENDSNVSTSYSDAETEYHDDAHIEICFL